MKYNFLAFVFSSFLALNGFSQQTGAWKLEDRQYLLANLSRTRDLVVQETKNLSPAQWNYKEAADKWSINQVLEHLCLWEVLLEREISQALTAGPRPELAKDARNDSAVLAFLMEEKQHIATEYTKPFTFTVPLGLNKGENNLTWFLKMRNEAINYVDTVNTDLRAYYLRPGRGNVHQVLITIFAHTDRHLRQIRRVKESTRYPKR